MKENETPEYIAARKEIAENDNRAYIERLERTNADKLARPEYHANLKGKVAILPDTNLADPILEPTAETDLSYEESLITAQFAAVIEKPAVSFTKKDILDTSNAAAVVDAVVIKRYKFTEDQRPEADKIAKAVKVAVAVAEEEEREKLRHKKITAAILDLIKPINFREIIYKDLKAAVEIALKEFDAAEDAKPVEQNKTKAKTATKKRIADREKIENQYLNAPITHSKQQIVVVDEIENLAKNKKFSVCYNNQCIHIYNGEYWKKIPNERFQKFLGDAAIKFGIDKYTADSYMYKDQLLKQFFSSAFLEQPEIDKNEVLINLLNGTFKIENGKAQQMQPFNEKDFLTYQLQFKFDANATAPIFEKYLDRVLPDKERQAVIAEFLGYVFIRHGSNILKEERTLILYGKGANGKSVLFEVVKALLGSENLSSYSLESLTDTNGYFRAMIDTKLLNYASEISNRMDKTRFKALVSGEPIEARHPAGRAMQIEQYAKLMFNCNVLPKAAADDTNAFFRRFLIVPFDETIPEEEQNKNLHSDIIESELAGVFNWILAGLERLIKQKRFSKCTASELALNTYQIESDSISLFLADENYQIQEKIFTELAQVYNEYLVYCSLSGYKAVNKLEFGHKLKFLKAIMKRGSGGKVMYGVSKLLN